MSGSTATKQTPKKQAAPKATTTNKVEAPSLKTRVVAFALTANRGARRAVTTSKNGVVKGWNWTQTKALEPTMRSMGALAATLLSLAPVFAMPIIVVICLGFLAMWITANIGGAVGAVLVGALALWLVGYLFNYSRLAIHAWGLQESFLSRGRQMAATAAA